jgi:periplasmic divalent cation tolerance protein
MIIGKMTDIWLIYSTFPKREEALSVARRLVEDQQIACANIIDGVTSVYRWQEALQEDTEVVMLVKTQAAKVDAVMEHIRALHSYDVPSITAWPLHKGQADFLQWVKDETPAG